MRNVSFDCVEREICGYYDGRIDVTKLHGIRNQIMYNCVPLTTAKVF